MVQKFHAEMLGKMTVFKKKLKRTDKAVTTVFVVLDKFNFKSLERREPEYCKLFLLPNKIQFNFIFEKDNEYY